MSRNNSLFKIISYLITLGLQSTKVFKHQWKLYLAYLLAFVPAVLRALLSGSVLSMSASEGWAQDRVPSDGLVSLSLMH